MEKLGALFISVIIGGFIAIKVLPIVLETLFEVMTEAVTALVAAVGPMGFFVALLLVGGTLLLAFAKR